MPAIHWVRSFLRARFRGHHLDAELDAELQSAIDELAARYQRQGAPPDEARRRARLAMGGVQAVRERTRAVRPGSALEAVAADLTHGARSLRRTPGFALAVVATFALAIGANTAIFSVVKELLIEPLPYREADRLVFIWSDLTAGGYPRAPLAAPELKDLRDRTKSFEGLGAIWANTAALTGGDDPEQLRVGLVTSDFFSVLGAEAALGRTFGPPEDEPGSPPTILLSWELWQRRFGGDAAVVGSQIDVNGVPTTVVGVMPDAFGLWMPVDANVPEDLQAWRPFTRAIFRNSRGQQYLRVVGRLRPGVTVEEASDEVFAVGRQVGREFADYGTSPPTFSAVSLHGDTVRELRPTLIALFGGVSLLLLLACVNVANLFIARASARYDETALRLALGAGRRRLLQHCLAEGVLLAVLGGLAGFAVATIVLDALLSLRPPGLSRVTGRIDSGVLLFTVAVSLAWGALISLAPFFAVQWRSRAFTTLARSAEARIAGHGSAVRLRAALVTVQVAISVVLLVAGGLLARTYILLQQADLGFATTSALTFRVAPGGARYPTPAHVNAFQAALQDALAGLPDVRGVGGVSHLPYDNLPNWGAGYTDANADASDPARNSDSRTITPGYLAAIGGTIVDGRDFTAADDWGRDHVAIVDQRLAERLWPGQSAVGKRIRSDPRTTGEARVPVLIVGVVKHMRHRTPSQEVREQIYFPQRQVLRSPLAFVVAAPNPAALADAVKAEVRKLDPRLPVYDVRPLADYLDRAKSVPRFSAVLTAAFSATALALAGVGVYGMLAYSVVRRRREIAVRIAVGARRATIVRLVVGEAVMMTLVGMVLGAAGAIGTAQLLRSQLYGVTPYDVTTYGVGLMALLACVLLATLGPVSRATGVRALDALRTE